jgi:hypothetical protein
MANDLVTVLMMHTLMKALAAGLPKLPATVTGVGVKGQTYTPQALADQITQLDAPYAASVKADQDKVAAEQALAPVDQTTRAFVGLTVTALKALLGRTSPALQDLGIEPDKVPIALTVEQKAAKTAKANATRKARGTMGKRQKERIHGTSPAATSPAPTTPILTPPAGTVPPKTGA